MGFFKKITRPLSRVLDKIIPNEIKPALPYLSAAAPFFGPAQGLMGTGLQRLAMGGGFNLAAQLAQEGNEGEVNPLSLGLATLTAGMTDPGAADYLQGLKTPYSNTSMEPVITPTNTKVFGSGFGAPRTGMQKFKDSALDYGIKGVNKIQGLQEAVDKGGMFSKEGAQLASIPITQGTMDNAYAQQNLLNKQSIIDDALVGLSEGFSNADASDAIRLSMLRYGFSEDEISETIISAGYKTGGRVGKMNGGIMNAKRGLVDAPGGYAGIEEEEVEFGGITEAVENVKEDKQRAYMELLDTASIDREADLRMERLNNLIEQGTSEDEAFKLVMPNAFSNDGKTDSEGRPIEVEEIKDYSKYKDIPIGIGNIKTGNVVEMYDNFKNRPDMLTLENVKNIPANLKNAGKEIYNAAGEVKNEVVDEYKMYKLYFNLSEKDKKEMKEMGFNDLFEVKDYITMRDSKAKGGIIGLNMGGSVLPQGMEMDYRGGGFIPMGSKERADDVPARVSKNEFVMTADAVKAAGGGSVNQGAKRMYDLMNNLEARV